MKLPYILNIQKYSIHDGDGIRTTVFFKGCPLSCAWCHNPESQSYHKELLFDSEKCTGCNNCTKACPHSAIHISPTECTAYTDTSICTLCDTCTNYCISGAREVLSRQLEIPALIKELEKDKMFYEQSGGGITLSGGEVMSQDFSYIYELMKRIHKKGFHLTVDTCGYAPSANFINSLPYVDTFLYDIKLINNDKHIKYMGKDNILIHQNLKLISDMGATIYLRIPIIGGVNDNDTDINDIITFIKDNIIIKQINLLPYHNIGSQKYVRLNKPYINEFTTPSDEKMKQIHNIFIENGFHNTKIGG